MSKSQFQSQSVSEENQSVSEQIEGQVLFNSIYIPNHSFRYGWMLEKTPRVHDTTGQSHRAIKTIERLRAEGLLTVTEEPHPFADSDPRFRAWRGLKFPTARTTEEGLRRLLQLKDYYTLDDLKRD